MWKLVVGERRGIRVVAAMLILGTVWFVFFRT
jgi:hypothetical protein